MKTPLRWKSALLLSRERADAKRQEDDVALWRDYHTFLKSKSMLLDFRISESHIAFERTDSLELEAEKAQGALDRIPASIRTMFEYVLEERRNAVRGEMEVETRANRSEQRSRNIDPDIIDRRALTELLAEAEGEVEAENAPRGYGWFPRGVAGDVRWYALNVIELLAAPTAGSYAIVTEKDDTQRRLLRAGLAGVGLTIFLLIWFLAPRGQVIPKLDSYAPVVSGITTSGGATSATPIAMDVWPIQSAVLTLGDTQLTIAVAATTNTTWPVAAEIQQGYWQRNAFAPLKLCVPPDLIEEVTAIRLAGGGSWPDRVYTVSGSESSTTNLILESCRSGTTPRRYGILQQTLPLPANVIGNPITLPGKDEAIIVRSIEIVGSSQDPALPTGQARIVVIVDGSPDRDWPSYAPTLLLSSGQAYLPAETIAQSNGVELRYLVPLPSGEAAVAWDITIPERNHIMRWRAVLPPPVSRVEVVRAAIKVVDVTAQSQDSALHISITIMNRGQKAFKLSHNDIVLSQGNTNIITPDIEALAAPLKPGEQRTLIVSLPGGGQQGLTLMVGTQVFSILS